MKMMVRQFPNLSGNVMKERTQAHTRLVQPRLNRIASATHESRAVAAQRDVPLPNPVTGEVGVAKSRAPREMTMPNGMEVRLHAPVGKARRYNSAPLSPL